MLVLTHEEGSLVHIGESIKLKVISITGKKIKIGYTAPKNISILRDEVKQRKENEQGDIQND